MSEYNKEVLFKNIIYLLTLYSKKIGEFENETGVSAGYISRASKDEKSKPGIEFVARAAKYLGTDIDSLVKVNYSVLSSTEKYILDFIHKLKDDTISGKIGWDRETAENLNNLVAENKIVLHPLFNYCTFFEESEIEYPEEITRPVMCSHQFDCHTCISGDCYNVGLQNNARLYMMNIEKSVHKINDKSAYAKEMWMVTQSGPQFICSNKESPLSEFVDDLYDIIVESYRHPRIDGEVKSVIDLFMTDNGNKKANSTKRKSGGSNE